MRATIRKICRMCKKEFQALEGNIDRGYGIYCSRSCAAKLRKRPKNGGMVKCSICYKDFYVSPYRLRTALFCSYKCKNKDFSLRTRGKSKPWKSEQMKGERNVSWKGGKPRVGCFGRFVQWNPKKGGRIYRDRLIAENTLGRELKKREVIHHINGNVKDDHQKNLFLFRQRSSHTRWHMFLKRHGLNGGILQSNLADLKV